MAASSEGPFLTLIAPSIGLQRRKPNSRVLLFSLRDAANGLIMESGALTYAMVVKGGSKSPIWMFIVISVIKIELSSPKNGDSGGAFGAARVAAKNREIAKICSEPEIAHHNAYNPELTRC